MIAPTLPPTLLPGALDGIRVVELASYISGPYAGMLMADFGADVIKIETPDGGDPFRGWGSTDYNPIFGSVNRGKRSVTIDLKTPDGIAEARRLIATADVVIENFRTGVLDRLGLGYEELQRCHPRLVYCSITGFGNLGPYATRPGYDTVGQAMGGLLSLLTDMATPDTMGISLSDHLAGITACLGVLAALNARSSSGRGQRVDTSLLESTIAFLAENAARYFDDGSAPDRATRTRLALVFAFVDGDGRPFVLHLSSPQKFWLGLLKVIDRPHWKADPRFADRTARMANYDQLKAELAAIFGSRPRDHWLALLEAEDVPCGPLYDLSEVFDDPQVKSLGMQTTAPHPARGQVSLIRSGVRMSETPPFIRAAAPSLGEHNGELLGDRAGKKAGG